MAMTWYAPFLAVALTPFLTANAVSTAAPSASAQQQTETVHDRKFWRAIAAHHYSIPPGLQVFPLVRELGGYLGSPDPELRDDLAYTILDVWIVYRNHHLIKGWIHSTAHTADLLGALAANPHFRAEDQARVLQAISERLSTAGQIFSYGEQDRLAVAVAAIAARKDFDAAGFHRWLSTLDESDRKVWKDSPPNDALLKTFQNNTYMLQALAARLYAKPKTPEITAALEEVIQILRKR